jgi:hypothetical protein
VTAQRFSRSSRSSFSSTAWRMKAERSVSPRAPSMRARSDDAQRIGTITVFSPDPPSGFLPIGVGVAAKISCANSSIHPCAVLYIRYQYRIDAMRTSPMGRETASSEQQAVLSELVRVKLIFQLRAIKAAMGVPQSPRAFLEEGWGR